MAYRLQELTWPQVEERVRVCPVALLPLGSTEQHGYHLPLGTDVFLARHLAERVSDEMGSLVLPDMNFGYSWVWRDRIGTVGVRQPLLQEVLKDVVRSVERWGVRVLAIVNGHEANSATIKYAVREISDETSVKVLGCFYPGLSGQLEEHMESTTWGGMFHADEFETSLALTACSGLVNMERAVSEYPERPLLYGMDDTSIGDLSASGVYGNPCLATREKGEAMYEAFTRNIVEVLATALDGLA